MQTEKTIQSKPTPRLWNYSEYYQMYEMGFFNGQRTEFIEGQIFVTGKISPLHATSICLGDALLHKIFSDNYFISVRCPLRVGEISELEPDLYVVKGNSRNFLVSHPTTAALVIEISDSSLAYDQTEKASLYAKANVPDYWIVNLKDRRLEVRRRPRKDDTQPFGYGYAETVIYTPKDSVSPLAKPKAKIRVVNLLPRKIS